MKIENLTRAKYAGEELQKAKDSLRNAKELEAKIKDGESCLEMGEYHDRSGIPILTMFTDGNFNVEFYTAVIASVIQELEVVVKKLTTEIEGL